MKRSTMFAYTCMAAGFVAAPAWAVSLSATGPAQPLAHPTESEANPDTVPAPEALAAPGSASLVPLMAAESASHEIHTVDGIDAPASGGTTVGSIDDIAFVALATESGRKERKSAQDAVPQLRDPGLREVAEKLIAHHDAANQRLESLAQDKGWPVPPAAVEQSAPAGTASPDFDARWTAEAISDHERSIALYRAQAQGGEDRDLRVYARESLPTLEQHLDWLRSLQK